MSSSHSSSRTGKKLHSSQSALALSISRRVFKHGNSLATTLPWTFAKALGIKAGQQIFHQATKAGNIVISDKPMFNLGSFSKALDRASRLNTLHPNDS